MKTGAKIIIIAMVIAFGMQSTAMAEWKFKSPGEITKNLGTMAAKNPQLQKAAKEKLNEEVGDKDKAANSEDDKDKAANSEDDKDTSDETNND
jgi:hypothetical protein